LIAVFVDDTTMFEDIDLDNALLDDVGTIIVKRRKVCASEDA
jgi:hypothetical protein